MFCDFFSNLPQLTNHISVSFSELIDGIQLVNKDGEKVGSSQVAAKRAIGQVVFSRIAMAAPGKFNQLFSRFDPMDSIE